MLRPIIASLILTSSINATAASAIVLPRQDGSCAAPNTYQGALSSAALPVIPSAAPPAALSTVSAAVVSPRIEYVWITEYTTVYPQATPPAATSESAIVVTETETIFATTRLPPLTSSIQTANLPKTPVDSLPMVEPSSTMLQYGPEFRGPSPTAPLAPVDGPASSSAMNYVSAALPGTSSVLAPPPVPTSDSVPAAGAAPSSLAGFSYAASSVLFETGKLQYGSGLPGPSPTPAPLSPGPFSEPILSPTPTPYLSADNSLQSVNTLPVYPSSVLPPGPDSSVTILPISSAPAAPGLSNFTYSGNPLEGRTTLSLTILPGYTAAEPASPVGVVPTSPVRVPTTATATAPLAAPTDVTGTSPDACPVKTTTAAAIQSATAIVAQPITPAPSSTAVEIIPISMSSGYPAKVARGVHPELVHEHIRWYKDTNDLDLTAPTSDEAEIATVQTTLETDTLPPFTLEVSRTRSVLKATPSPSNTVKPSAKFSPTVRPTPTGSADPESHVYTTSLSADPRCPYPYPGIYCGNVKTTLATQTKKNRDEATSTSKEPKSSSWCPYPGRGC